MKLKSKIRLLILFICCLFPLAVFAQGAQPADIVVNSSEVTETQDDQGNDALHMDMLFTVLDGSGAVIPNAVVDSAEIVVDGERYSAEVKKPATPIYLAIALDTSGSMAESADAMREAAITAVDNAPDVAMISIVRFNEAIAVTSFTDDKLRTGDSVRGVEIESKGTCLYDAAYKAVSAATIASDGVSGARRAVLFFTDGKDEITSGQGDTCSTRTFDEVVGLASQPEQPVTIHTIGLGDAVDPRLPELAQLTGGQSASVADATGLDAAFLRIASSLEGQLLARADMYPSAGQKTATLEAIIGGTPINEAVSFNAARDFAPPAQPLAVQQTNLTYDEVADTFSFNAILDGTLEQIGKIQLAVVGGDGVQIGSYDFEGFEPPWVLNAEALDAGQTYAIELYAFDAEGTALLTPDGEARLDSAEFEYLPVAVEPTAEAAPVVEPSIALNPIEINEVEQTIMLNAVTTAPEQIAGYEIQIVNPLTGELVESVAADFGSSATVQLPLAMLGEGGNRVIVNAFNSEGALLGSDQQDFTYTSPVAPEPAPQPQQNSGFSLNPLIPLSIILLLLAGVGAYFLSGLLKKRKSGQPTAYDNNRSSSRRHSTDRRATPDYSATMQTMDIDVDSPHHHQTVRDRDFPTNNIDETIADIPGVMVPATGPRLSLTVERAMGSHMIGREVPLDTYPFVIGREGSNLSMESEPHLSRQHAEITFDGRDFYITDLGSRNGVYIDGKRINVHTATPLPIGTPIGFGRSVTCIVNPQ